METGIADGIDISVVIASYNSAPLVFRTLHSLAAQEGIGRDEYEVILADSSTDGTPDAVRERFPDVRVVHSDERKYPGAARNMGIVESRGKILVFIDADAAASPKWLERIRHHHRKEGIAAVGGPIFNGNPGEFMGWIPYWAEFTGYTARSPETMRRVIPTCNLSIKREAFQKYGPFLEEQFGNEDVLLTENLRKAGLSPVFRRDMPVFHTNRNRWSEIVPHMRKLGRCTGVARMKYDIAGASTFRGWKKHVALPLVPLYKWALISGRIIRDEPWHLPRLLITSPWLFGALMFWTLGMKDGLDERE